MLSLVIRTRDEVQYIMQTKEIRVQNFYAVDYADYEGQLQEHGNHTVLTSPHKGWVGNISFRLLSLEGEDGVWEDVFIYDCDVYVMNENGKTIATYHA